MMTIDIQKPLHTAQGAVMLSVQKEIARGDFLTLFGKSGSGKTTLLRMIAGLETPQSGRIVVDDVVWFDSVKGINLPPQKRKTGFVFQDYALFSHLSVRDNIAFAAQLSTQEIDEIMALMELEKLSHIKPHALSGGQKQRVAVARALAARPSMLLLDEPLSALDYAMRAKLQEELSAIHSRFGMTAVLVSHDISEVFRLSNRVWKLSSGTITADGTPSAVFASATSSGKFKLTGEVLSIKKSDILYIVSVLSHGEIVQVTALESEIQALNVGDRILMSSKAHNPLLTRIS